MMLDRLNAERCGDVGFARSRAADGDDVVRAIDKVAAMQLAHQGLIDLAGSKIEAGQIHVDREPRSFHLTVD